MAARGFLGGGDLYIARFVGGVPGPLMGPYECNKFEIKPNVEVKEQVSRGRSTRGQVIESVPLAQPSDLTVELPEVNKESLAIALLGTATAIAQGAGTVVNQAITARLGAWVRTVHENISAVVVTNVAGSTTYVNAVDYEFNSRLGMIRAIAGGAIADNTAIHVDYAYAAVNGTSIAGSTNTQVRALFLLDGKNFADDLPCQVQVWEAVIAADSAFDFMSDDFANVSLPGRLKTPVGRTEPFVVRLLDTLI